MCSAFANKGARKKCYNQRSFSSLQEGGWYPSPVATPGVVEWCVAWQWRVSFIYRVICGVIAGSPCVTDARSLCTQSVQGQSPSAMAHGPRHGQPHRLGRLFGARASASPRSQRPSNASDSQAIDPMHDSDWDDGAHNSGRGDEPMPTTAPRPLQPAVTVVNTEPALAPYYKDLDESTALAFIVNMFHIHGTVYPALWLQLVAIAVVSSAVYAVDLHVDGGIANCFVAPGGFLAVTSAGACPYLTALPPRNSNRFRFDERHAWSCRDVLACAPVLQVAC